MAEIEKIQEYQHLLDKLPGILSSRIIADANTITEIHILSDITRGPKQIVRDVQSALSARFDLTVDHKIISVAQIEEGSLSSARQSRLLIDSIKVRSEQGKVEVNVILGRDEQTFEGSASGGNSAQGRLRVVAEAALHAIHKFLNKDFLFVLSDAVKINLADRKAIAVSILHFTSLGEEYLSGSAIIKTDDNEAVVKATLDAVNRRLFQHI